MSYINYIYKKYSQNLIWEPVHKNIIRKNKIRKIFKNDKTISS